MAIKVTCPECDTVNKVADEKAGKRVRCKSCDAKIDVPEGRRAKKSSKSQGGSNTMLFVIGGGAIVLVLVLCVAGSIGGYFLFRDKPGDAKKGDQARDGKDGKPLIDRNRSTNNLKQIGLGLHAYHDVNRAFPPAGLGPIANRGGTPLLSWRVAILPYIDQQALYQQFDLNQPWDSPRNKPLIAQMPQIYALPGAGANAGETHYRVLVGPGTVFERRSGGQGIRMLEITDGTSNTFMVVEAKDPTIWTRPDDLVYTQGAPLPKFGLAADGFDALFGDCSVRFIRSSASENLLRGYITRNGGEVVIE